MPYNYAKPISSRKYKLISEDLSSRRSSTDPVNGPESDTSPVVAQYQEEIVGHYNPYEMTDIVHQQSKPPIPGGPVKTPPYSVVKKRLANNNDDGYDDTEVVENIVYEQSRNI